MAYIEYDQELLFCEFLRNLPEFNHGFPWDLHVLNMPQIERITSASPLHACVRSLAAIQTQKKTASKMPTKQYS